MPWTSMISSRNPIWARRGRSRHTSRQPLSDLSRSMMRVSQNQHAEILLKAIGGRRTVQDILKGWAVSG